MIITAHASWPPLCIIIIINFATRMQVAVQALLDFLHAHAGFHVLDAAAMAQLKMQLVPRALAEWPDLQRVLQTKVRRWSWSGPESPFRWIARGPATGFDAALTRDEVFALTQLLLLKVGGIVFF